MAQYLKPDTELGYIEEPAEIELLKFNNLRHVVTGCMLGDFDERGSYVVDSEIIQELIEMPKYIVDSLDNIEICKSFLRLDKQITFAVTFEGNKATLSLLEKLNFESNIKINSGTYSNINEYVIDEVETSGEINRNVIYRRWNIESAEGNIIDIFNCDDATLEKYFGIVNRFKYLLQANKILLEKEEQLEEIESSYSNEMVEVLKRYPKLKEVVLTQISETLKEKKNAVTIKKPNFSKTFNEILDNAIQSNISVLDEKEQQEFEAERRNAVVNLNVKRSEILESETINVENEDNAEFGQKIVRIKTENNNLKTITEIGEEFVSANKKLEEKKKGETLTDKTPETEKEKLLATLVGAGLGTVIGGTTGAVVGAAVGSLVAEVTEKVANAKQNNVKSGLGKSVSKPTANKGAAKGGAKKAGGNSKPAGAKKAGSSTEVNKIEEQSNSQNGMIAKTTKKKRRHVGTVLSVSGEEVNGEKNKIVANKLTPEQLMQIEQRNSFESENTLIGRVGAKNLTENIQANTVVGKESRSSKIVVNTNSKIIATEKVSETTIIGGGLDL